MAVQPFFMATAGIPLQTAKADRRARAGPAHPTIPVPPAVAAAHHRSGGGTPGPGAYSEAATVAAAAAAAHAALAVQVAAQLKGWPAPGAGALGAAGSGGRARERRGDAQHTDDGATASPRSAPSAQSASTTWSSGSSSGSCSSDSESSPAWSRLHGDVVPAASAGQRLVVPPVPTRSIADTGGCAAVKDHGSFAGFSPPPGAVAACAPRPSCLTVGGAVVAAPAPALARAAAARGSDSAEGATALVGRLAGSRQPIDALLRERRIACTLVLHAGAEGIDSLSLASCGAAERLIAAVCPRSGRALRAPR